MMSLRFTLPLVATGWAALLGGMPVRAAEPPVPIDDAAGLRAAVAENAELPVPAPLPRAQLLARAQRLHAALSPDGLRLAWIAERGGRRGVWLRALPGGEPRALLAQTDADEVIWSHDGQWLLLPGARRLAAVATTGRATPVAVSDLGGALSRRFLWVDPTQPAAVLLLESPPRVGDGRWRLLRATIGGDTTVLHEDTRQIVDVALAADGRVAWLLLADGDGHALMRIDANGTPRPVRRCEDMRRCLLIGVAPDGGAWLHGNPDSDRVALLHVGTDGATTVLHTDPRGEADLADVAVDPDDGHPRFAAYRSTVPQLHALDAADASALARLRHHLPGAQLQVEPARGADAPWLVRERGDRLRGERLHWYDVTHDRLVALDDDEGFVFAGRSQPRPDATALARKRPVRWQASDRRWITGFLTLPPGRDAARAPVVAIVHGGPFNLVRPDFSNDAQLLANRGYVVLQPNFRGSTGHGRETLFAANGDFGNGRVQQDIVDGVRWLLANGIGDGDRVGIAGASFGGYSALQGVTWQPELFKVAVAGVPPTEFGRVLREYIGAGQQMLPGIPMATTLRQLSLDPADTALAARLAEQSPVAGAATLQRPVLLLAGGTDERVPIRGVTHYAALLTLHGKDVTLFVDTGAGHVIADDRSREAYYFLMETLLHRHLGGDAPEPASAVLREHLREHLRLPGAIDVGVR